MLDPVDLARELAAIPSPTGHEHAVVAFLADRLRALGWTVDRQPVSGGRDNLYARRSPPVVVLSTHLDTVPPELPFREDADTLHGRGVCDAKGIAAAMVAAAEELAAHGETRVALLFVVGEEDGSDGARRAVALEPKGRYLVNGEPTDNRLVTAQKGTLKVEIDVTGRAAHSGYPELGDSAIDALIDILARVRAIRLPRDPVLGEATINIGRVSGGEAPNVVAPSARAELLVRLVGPDDSIRRAISEAVGPRGSVSFVPGIPPATGAVLPGWSTTTVAFASDLAFHGAWGRCFQLGPGSIHVAHSDHERIAKAELREGTRLYVRLARELLAGAAA